MTPDKNGKELKVGDKVRDDYYRSFTIIALNEYSDFPIETINDMIGDGWTFASHFVELDAPAPIDKWSNSTTLAPAQVEPTYTAEDIKEAFEAGANRNYYEAEGFDAEYFAPDFAQFMDVSRM